MSATSKNGATEFKVIKAAKLPPARLPRGSRSKFPLLDLEVGDSFVVPPEHAGSVRTAAYLVAKAYGVKFTSRTLADGCVQVWRVRLDGRS